MKRFQYAKWIAGTERSNAKKIGGLSPALQLRKSFFFTEQKAEKAICAICGLGVYSLYINGKRVGNDVLSPAFTAYDKRALFSEYDVSEYLQRGENVIAVKLGGGFYDQSTHDTWDFCFAPWRDALKLLLELTVDGQLVCVSDDTWKTTSDGATIHNAIRTGESYDARKEDGWRTSGYDDGSWENAYVVAPPGGVIAEEKLPPIRECETYAAERKWRSKKGWIFDFGKNIAGYVSLRLQGEAGKTVALRYAEKLKDGELDQSNIDLWIFGDREFATDKYTFKGAQTEEWKPEFVYHGFRYVELTGVEKEPSLSALQAHFVHTDLSGRGSFSCDHELLSWIYEAGIRSFLSNCHGISEDCPHREKNGWTGDSVISCDYAVALYEMKEFYRKWLEDFKDAQRSNGQLPGIIPTSGWGYNWGSGPAWDCALFVLPYTLYKETGDAECLLAVRETAEKYLEYARYYRTNGLVCFGLSDWCPPENVPDLKLMSNLLSDSCFYYKMQRIMAEILRLAGENERGILYAEDAEETKRAICERFIDGDSVDNDGQGALASVVYFGVVEGAQAQAIADKLAQTVERDGFVAKVGILGMKALLTALSDYGHVDVAYKIVTREDYPSYAFCRKQGATSLWENWDGSGSLNHQMYSDVVHWMFRWVGGLQNLGVAYDECALKPFFYTDTCEAESRTKTARGELCFSWRKEKNLFSADLTLPDGVRAKLYLPNGRALEVSDGRIEVDLCRE